jgi:hypothetical protein
MSRFVPARGLSLWRPLILTTLILSQVLSFADQSYGASGSRFRLVVQTGDPVPGASAGETFAWLSGTNDFTKAAPRISADGDLSFSGGWTSPVSSSGLFQIVGSIAAPVVLVGDPAPGTSTDFVGFPIPFTVPAKLSSGVSVFDGSADNFGDTDGVWGNRFGPIEKILLPGDHHDGTVATAKFFQWSHRFVGTGIFVINSTYTVPGSASLDYHGFWRDSAGTLDLVTAGGEPAPDTAAGVEFGTPGGIGRKPFDAWDVDTLGQVAFKALIKGTGVTDRTDEGIWTESSGTLRLLVREGDAIASIPGSTFDSISGFKTFDDAAVFDLFLNDAGHLAFGANFDLAGAGYSNGVFSTRSGSLELVVLARPGGSTPPGDLAPGFSGGEAFVAFGAGIMGDAGNLAFNAFVDAGGTPSGVWAAFVEDGGSLAYVMKAGDPVPDQPGRTFRADRIPLFNHLTGDGELFFRAETNGPEGPGSGLFARKSGGPLRCIVATGQNVEVAPGDIREVRLVVSAPGFSDQRETAVHLSFTDGTEGIFFVDEPRGTSAPQARLSALKSFGPSHPNPFNPRTTIPFVLDRQARVQLAVFDVAGRRVAVLVDGLLPEGDYSSSWDGRDESGRTLASGSYFARIEVGGVPQTRKLVLLK